MFWFDRIDQFLPSRKKKKDDTQLYGVEVEMEFNENPNEVAIDFDESDVTNFKVENDGSLRNGLEFVLSRPLNKERTLNSVNNLYNFIKGKDYRIFEVDEDGTIARTSTHVHADVRNLNTAQIFAIITIWAFYEYEFIEKLDEERLNSKYCLTDYITPNNLNFKYSILGGAHSVYRAKQNGNRYRYSMLNICDPALHIGSIEFRGMQGNVDIEKFKCWLEIIDNFMTVCKKFDTPEKMYTLYNALSNHPNLFFKKMFGRYPKYETNALALDAAQINILGESYDTTKNPISLSDL